MNPYLEGVLFVQEVTTGVFSLACVVLFGYFAWDLSVGKKIPLLSPTTICLVLSVGGFATLLVGVFTGQSNAFDEITTTTEHVGILVAGLGVCVGWIFRPIDSM